ncbi:hypothetical protein PPSIR1_38344 [Plesiocystis pacifica SIR-1]|uniref:PDZ domain-containing protein n=1 Tax=Plesiocystis pacifica SIR-1 TaxID=391625 RepID=A6G8J2_9BACT|nr:hypothetical protein [Plesiocystis pacifica]EDM77769.1 hypothetical protein PPSIR1_38344 [Plesiocystis pacifica SIR-1]
MNIFRLSAITVSLTCTLMTACGPVLDKDEEDNPCTKDCLPGESAVICETNVFNQQIICAPSVGVASASCAGAGGVAQEVAVCPDGGGDEAGGGADDEAGSTPDTSEDSELPTWTPSDYVSLDPSSGAMVIDAEALDALERDPSPLFDDGTHLGRVDGGYFRVTRVGPLAEAMGWESGDVLHELNGYAITSTEDFLLAWEALDDETELRLAGLRDGAPVVLSYRVE